MKKLEKRPFESYNKGSDGENMRSLFTMTTMMTIIGKGRNPHWALYMLNEFRA